MPCACGSFRLGPAINRDQAGTSDVGLFTVRLCARGRIMSDRSDEFRKAAQDCLQLARATSDPGTRAALLLMAQKWFDLADGSPGQGRLDAAIGVQRAADAPEARCPAATAANSAQARHQGEMKTTLARDATASRDRIPGGSRFREPSGAGQAASEMPGVARNRPPE
jgi:hypothetical protein